MAQRMETGLPSRFRATAIGLSLAALVATIGAVHAQTFSVGANFTTITRQQTTTVSGEIIEPPDTMGAAGPNDFVAFNNGSFSIYSKAGNLISQVSDTSFWTTALGSNPGELTDPRVFYDPESQRWFASMVTTDQTTNNNVLIARSNTSDPTQGFKAVSFSTLGNRFADFPMLGFDTNGVYLTTNNFNTSDAFRSVSVYSLPKADLIASTPTLANLTSRTALSPNTYGFSLQPAVDYGPKSASAPEPIVATSNTSSTQYKFTPLSGTSDAGATLGSPLSKTVQSYPEPTNSPQPGTSTTIDDGDDRFAASVVQIGNFLYAVHGTTVSGRSAARWTIADATTFNIVQQGTISDPALSFFYPSIAVNPTGDVVVGFSGSSSSTYASTYAVVGSSAGGVPGGTLTFGSPVQTKAGADSYTDTRWGDYSAVTPDPADPGIFWAYQEFAANRFTNGGTTYGNWATQASEIIPTKSGELRWSNTAGGDFATGGNYFTGAAPVATDLVIFSRPSASYTVTFSGSSTSDRASVRQGNVTWNLAGGSYALANSSPATPSLTVGEFQGAAVLTVSGGALDTVNAAVNMNSRLVVEDGGALIVAGASGGNFSAAAGSEIVLNDGTINAGNAALSPTATLRIGLRGTDAGEFGVLSVTDQAALDGTFEGALFGGFMPALGDTFPVMTFGSRSGDFTSYLGLDVGGHLALQHAFTATSLVLKAMPAVSGDINLDGVVNIFDIDEVSAYWGSAGPQGDANGDGIVDIFDINLISANWGAMDSGGAQAVPEPASIVLLCCGAVGVMAARRRVA
jgi:hypothetical protein